MCFATLNRVIEFKFTLATVAMSTGLSFLSNLDYIIFCTTLCTDREYQLFLELFYLSYHFLFLSYCLLLSIVPDTGMFMVKETRVDKTNLCTN